METDIAKEYLDEKAITLSPETIKNYEGYLRRFRLYINKPLQEVHKEDINGYIHYLLMDRHLSKSGCGTIQTAIISFYNWCFDNNKIIENPVAKMAKIKPDKKLPIYLLPDERERFFTAATNPRDNLMVKLLYVTGVRVSELVGIKMGDINFDTGDIKVFGKGSKERIVICNPCVLQHLKEYTEGFPTDQKVFPMATESVERIVRKLKVEAGINKHITPHKLRHTFATDMLTGGANIVLISGLLGHSSLKTTQIYTHTSLEQAHNAHNSIMSKIE